MTTLSPFRRILAVAMMVISVMVFVLWAFLLAQGVFPDGPFAYDEAENGIPAFHLTAEFLMAAVTLVGGIGLWTGARWGRGVSLVGLGTFGYSAINAMGWAVVNDPAQAIPMAVALVVALVGIPYLLRAEGG